MSGTIIIGAGQAGSAAAAKLRNLGYEGDITLIGAETAPPYQRPPLSKKYMLGEMDLERLYLRPIDFYETNNITLRLGTKVDAIDTTQRSISVQGETLSYGNLILTTGSWPRRLPAKIGGDLAGVYSMRDLAELCDEVKERAAWSEAASDQGARQVEQALVCERRAVNAIEKALATVEG